MIWFTVILWTAEITITQWFENNKVNVLTAGCPNHVLELCEKFPGSLLTRKIMYNTLQEGSTLRCSLSEIQQERVSSFTRITPVSLSFNASGSQKKDSSNSFFLPSSVGRLYVFHAGSFWDHWLLI